MFKSHELIFKSFMKLNFYKHLGRGLSISILALISLSTVVYHDDVFAAKGGGGGSDGAGAGGARSGADASGSKSENASDTGKAARGKKDNSYEVWLLELLKE